MNGFLRTRLHDARPFLAWGAWWLACAAAVTGAGLAMGRGGR